MRRYEAQARLFTTIKVARDVDIAQQIGRDMYFDLVDHDKVRHFRIWKQTPFSVFKAEVATEFGIPAQFQRFWIWAKRQNHTYRPRRPLTAQEEAQPVGQLREVSNSRHNAELKLFLEVEFGPDLTPIPPPEISKEDILLFFKLYDPQIGELRYVGRLFVKSSGKPIEILGKLNRMANFAPDEEIELYEEIKFKPSVMCEHLDKQISFRSSQIEDGDIICFQKALLFASDYEYPEVPSFLEYVHNCQIRLETEQEQEVRRRYEAQAHFFTIIKVARDEDLAQQIGRDIYFDLIDHHKVRHFRVWKQTPFSVFKEEVATEFGIPAQFQRFWIWTKRQNNTYRPHRPLTAQEEAQPVGPLRELNLFLEVEFGPDLRPIPPPEISEEDILVFFKLYEPEIRELQYVGRLFVKSSSKPIEILGKLNRMANFAPDEEIELYEEIKFKPSVVCEHLDKQISFRSSQIQDGDIICFQKDVLFASDYEYPDVTSFLEYVYNQQVASALSIKEIRQSNKSGDDASRNKPMSVRCQGGELEKCASHAVHKSNARIQDHEAQDPVVEPVKAATCDDQDQEMPKMEALADDSLAVGRQMNNDLLGAYSYCGASQDKVGMGEVRSAASFHVPDISEVPQSSPEIQFDEMAVALLEKLEDEKAPNSVRMSDFNDTVSSNFVEVSIFRVPSSLEYYAKELLASHVDISAGLSSVQYVNEAVFTVLCCALKSMDATPFNEVTESLILKWRDAIRGALQFGFKVDFLKDHLKSITHIYLGKLAKDFRESKELQAIDKKITEMEKDLASLRILRAQKSSKICTYLREVCETAAANFQGNTPGTGLR